MRHSKITFLMTAHNSEGFICEAIESVLNQTEPNIALIIRNNASSDSTKDICLEYAGRDDRITYLENKTNWVTDEGEPYKSRKWWPEFNSNYIAFIDHDDILHKDFARVMFQRANSIKAQIAACGRASFSNQTEQIEGVDHPPNIISKNPKELEHFFLEIYNPVCRTLWGKLYRTDFFEKYYDEVRKFPPGLNLSTDTWIVLGYMERCRIFTSINVHLYFYRMSGNSGYYNSKPALSRIGEGAILYDRGKGYLEAQGVASERNQEVLERIYLGHIRELLDLAVKSRDMLLEEKIEYIQHILSAEKFARYSMTHFEISFDIISYSLKELLSDLSQLDSRLWRYYLVRLWDSINKNEKDPFAFLFCLSAVYDSENTGLYGYPLLLNKWEYLKEKKQGETSFTLQEALEQIYLYSETENQMLIQNELMNAIEAEELERAAELLEQLTDICPENEYAVYVRLLLAVLVGEYDFALRQSYAASSLFPEQEEIQSICAYIQEEWQLNLKTNG